MKTLLTLSLLVVSTLSLAQEPYHMRAITYDPGGTGTIVSKWTLHLGNQDPNETDHQNWGLLMSKNAATPVNAAAFAQVYLSNGSTTLNIHVWELGYDIRNGSHCGGGPRFNVITDVNFHFVGGCANGTITPGTHPGWRTVRFDTSNPAQAFPPILPSEVVKKIYLVHDEGTDAGGAPDMSGIAIFDDIEINGILIGEPN